MGTRRGSSKASSSARRRNRAALAQAVRLALPRARAGDAAAHARLVTGLRSQLSQATDETERFGAHLMLGILLEPRRGFA